MLTNLITKSVRPKSTLTLVLISMTLALAGCGKVDFDKKDKILAQQSVTQSGPVTLMPNDDPSIPDGKAVYEKLNCAVCHGPVGKPVSGKATVDLSNKDYMRSKRPTDQYLFLSYDIPEKAGFKHPQLSGQLTQREIWDLVIYTRSLAVPPLTDDQFMAIDPVFGSNCAVCHGKKGYGDGPLAHNLEPVPANFQQFDRFYNRTDAELWDHIANGIKWEGMPNFLNKTDKAKNVKFDKDYIWKLVSYVRRFEQSNDATSLAKKTPVD